MKFRRHLMAVFIAAILLSCNVKDGSKIDQIKSKGSGAQTGMLADTANGDALTILKNLLYQGNVPGVAFGNEGHEVRLDSALACVALFKPLMNKYAIMDSEQAVNVSIHRSWKITEHEEFGGRNLLEWMLKTANKYDPNGHGKNIGIRLSMGIYTDDFLNTYLGNNPKLKAKKKDRITIFLIPVSKTTHQYISADQEATAYDLGGLQP